MSNSTLINYTKISPHKDSPRNHAIDTVTIHCVVGQLSVESLGNVFQNKKASANYGIGPDGRIGMYVEEADRSWCSSNADNDNRAITIEVASDTKSPYAVKDEAYNALIKLLVDICQRNNIKELKWKADKSLIGQVDKQNMTVHRWFAAKSCPGKYLYDRHGQIAEEVNTQLKALEEAAKKKEEETEQKEEVTIYRIQTGAYKVKANAEKLAAKLKAAGFSAYIVQYNSLYKVQVGAYKVKANASKMVTKLKAAGFNAFITTISGTTVSTSTGTTAATTTTKKSVEAVAREIIQGKWGNGSDRKNRLTKAGYTAEEIKAIQDRVNELL